MDDRVLPLPRELEEALALRAGRRGALGSALRYLEATSSTNDVADRMASAGAAHGTVVVADSQRSGRGRMGRAWFSPPGAGLYVSIVLRPGDLGRDLEEPAQAGAPPVREPAPFRDLASHVSLAAGVALAEAIRAATGLRAEIKWPNDLVVDRRKLCGILAEASSSAHAVQHVVLGYGINVQPAAYPPDIVDRATSLEGELGRPVDRWAVLAESLASLGDWMSLPLDRVIERWRALSPSSNGVPVEVSRATSWVPARTAGIDADGALLVTAGGVLHRVIAGEVRWL